MVVNQGHQHLWGENNSNYKINLFYQIYKNLIVKNMETIFVFLTTQICYHTVKYIREKDRNIYIY